MGSLVFGLSLDLWNNLIVAFGIISGTFVVLTGGATYIAFELQKQEASAAQVEFIKYKAGVAAEVAKANADAAEANERAAKLEKEASSARLETERLKAQLSWRTLSKDAADHLLTSLVKETGSVNIWYTMSDPEAEYLAIQLVNIFTLAHWNVGFASYSLSGGLIFGIKVPQSDDHGFSVISSAFAEAHLQFLLIDCMHKERCRRRALRLPGQRFLSVRSHRHNKAKALSLAN